MGEKERSLLAYEEPGPKSTELIPSSISISSIFIHGFLLCFSLAPLPFLSLGLCNVIVFGSFLPITCLALPLRHFFQLLIDNCCSLYIFLEKHFDRKLKQVVIPEFT